MLRKIGAGNSREFEIYGAAQVLMVGLETGP
jgi:hypothetical protein